MTDLTDLTCSLTGLPRHLMRHLSAIFIGTLFSVASHAEQNMLRDLFISNFQDFDNTIHYQVTGFCYFEQHEKPVRSIPAVGETAIGSFLNPIGDNECFGTDVATQLSDDPKYLNLVRALRDASDYPDEDQLTHNE